ncbi:hypothetical protein [Nostocoides sp. HKS02]|uniref:hypothetical protein n=1 Tax=Nostocoides sp. HKS02 TaxID=1813880 RepID=UPI001E3E43E3|nr:hypothetical protein [Tetrasphaera sp. HKS02]
MGDADHPAAFDRLDHPQHRRADGELATGPRVLGIRLGGLDDEVRPQVARRHRPSGIDATELGQRRGADEADLGGVLVRNGGLGAQPDRLAEVRAQRRVRLRRAGHDLTAVGQVHHGVPVPALRRQGEDGVHPAEPAAVLAARQLAGAVVHGPRAVAHQS